MSVPSTLAARSARAFYGVVGNAAHGAVTIARGVPGLGSRTREHLAERIGRYASARASASARPSVWVHAASVGEVRAVEPLVAALRARHPGAAFTFTCQTETGRALARSIGADAAHIAPLDSGTAVTRAIDRFRPEVFLLVENEIWPRLLTALADRGVPAGMVNARVSERSFRRYSLVPSLFRAPLATLARVCARDEESARRLVALGARTDATSVTGDLKLAALDETIVTASSPTLPMHEGGPRYALAISTHEGEDEIVLAAFARARARHPSLRLVLAPRHPGRRDAVLALAEPYGRSLLWSAAAGALDTDWSVLVVDTTGEMRGFLRSAACGFVGGSLVPAGGHNLAEPAAFRVPVAVGPHLEGVAHQAGLLEAQRALVVVRDAEELADAWHEWLANPQAARAVAHAAHEAFVAGASALPRTLAAIEPLLEERSRARAT